MRRLLCSAEEKHILLAANKVEKHDILSNMPMFFKICVEDKLAPGWLHIKYAEG
jgi:hypothetical protein